MKFYTNQHKLEFFIKPLKVIDTTKFGAEYIF